MPYDDDLADRVRDLVGVDPDVDERRMFGGLAFLVSGNMAITVSGKGGLLVRVDPTTHDDLLASTPATIAVMRGREMRGWLRVAADDVRTKRQLRAWFDRSMRYVRTLPPKPGSRARPTR